MQMWPVWIFSRRVLGAVRGELDDAMDVALEDLLRVDPQADALVRRFSSRWTELARRTPTLTGGIGVVPEHLAEEARRLIQEVRDRTSRPDRTQESSEPADHSAAAANWFIAAEAALARPGDRVG
jgi:hypothetical protein